ncbi:hypothetical protein KKB99_01555, partial [bacterium]|nr:hypothetical protein [bacterium]MBU1024672.1 hypothetical protein [bacterium]
GNFQIDVRQVTSPTPDRLFEGSLDGAYNSIENGKILIRINKEGTSLTIERFSGTLVGDRQTEGAFNFTDASVFGEIPIDLKKFTSVGTNGNDVIEINGCISDEVASGVVIYQREGNAYIGAFSAWIK